MNMTLSATFGGRRGVGLVAGALLMTGVAGGWAMSTTLAANAAVTGARYGGEPGLEASKTALVGSYRVTGTDADGTSYAADGVLDIALAPSGALELSWDDGKMFGVGEVVGNVLAVASLSKGRTVILTMRINADGSLAGNWLRRTDRGTRGTELWKKS
jgi:hypothetical protein